ncbi:MAG TPA: S9 family peptidase [Rhizomicrobium sp.]|nr:S9 family peptidase [Rhizomicrobium sp.]
MSFRAWGVLCCALFFAWSAAAQPTVEDFGRLPAFTNPVISPDGKHIAAIQEYQGRPVVVIYEVGAPKIQPAVVTSDDMIVDGIEWVKNDRLAVYLKRTEVAGGDWHMRTWRRTVTVSPQGKDMVLLNEKQPSMNLVNTAGGSIIDSNLDDPDIAFAPLEIHDLDGSYSFDVLAVNVRTGSSRRLMSGTRYTYEWFMDGHGHVVARIDRTVGPLTDHLKFYDGSEWHDAGDFDVTGDKDVGLVGLTEDGKAAVFFGWDDTAHRALFARNLASRDKGSVLFSNTDYDLDDVLLEEGTGRVIGALYADDAPRYVYFDPKLEALQRGLEQAFPNLSAVAASKDLSREHIIVAVEGPRHPLGYYFLDRTTHKAQPIASTYPDLSAADLGEMRPFPYKARDGLGIHAYLTLPPGSAAKNLPLVVMPHGGPEARDALGFDWMAQFFANRGYAVFQPNFRGSSGYGHKLIEAGNGQWGLKMQDDITDGVKKLIADGVADPKRVCIVGASYGGYAALAGAAFTPDLYACAVSFAGISDLKRMLSTEEMEHGTYSGIPSYLNARLGDDSDRLRATSPALHVDQIKCPILLMHGENDTTVRIRQSEVMYEALKAAGKDVQFIRFPGEDHYFNFADTRIRFLTETEKFLAAHIGPGVTAAAK